MQYEVRWVHGDSTQIEPAKWPELKLVNLNDLPTHLLKSVGLEAYYKDVGLSQFDDLLYELDRNQLSQIRKNSIHVFANSIDDLVLGDILDYIDLLSQHLRRKLLTGFCEIIVYISKSPV